MNAPALTTAAPRVANHVTTERNDLIVDALGESSEVADLVGGYVLADPQAVTALQNMVRRSAYNMGAEANREAFIQAALQFAQSVYEHADAQWGAHLVEKQRERDAEAEGIDDAREIWFPSRVRSGL